MEQNFNPTSNPLESFLLSNGQQVPPSLYPGTSSFLVTPYFAPVATHYGSNWFIPQTSLAICQQPAPLSGLPMLDTMLGMQQLLGVSHLASSPNLFCPRFYTPLHVISLPQQAPLLALLSQVNTGPLVPSVDLNSQNSEEDPRPTEEVSLQNHAAAGSYNPPSNRSAFFPFDQGSGLPHKRPASSQNNSHEPVDHMVKVEGSPLSSSYSTSSHRKPAAGESSSTPHISSPCSSPHSNLQKNCNSQAKSGGSWGKAEDGSISGRHKPWKIALTDAQAQEIFVQRPKIKELYGFGSSQLGEKYMVNAKTIRDIWNRETWVKATKHLWTSEEIIQDAEERERKRFKSSSTEDEASASSSKKN
uniref:Uncharacterized protein n=1 Tax=Hanusia phi TaxID=3032 RepID=A0A7S0E4U9_9CRYP|mmetsp:Transcript_16752/g.38220  ORF Transcript_16752/g.38220 Transcript_16752/m.38220 type:complete len:359 (+) Transcript_16752:146-1222(+)